MELKFTARRHKGSLWTIVTMYHNLQRIKDFSSTHIQLYKYLIWVTKYNSITNSKKSWHGFRGKITNNATVNHFSDLFSNQKSAVMGL